MSNAFQKTQNNKRKKNKTKQKYVDVFGASEICGLLTMTVDLQATNPPTQTKITANKPTNQPTNQPASQPTQPNPTCQHVIN